MKKLLIVVICASVLFGFVNLTQAKPWNVSSEFSYINTTGNTRTRSVGVKNDLVYYWTDFSALVKASAYSTRERNTQTAENYLLSEKVRWQYESPNYLFQLGIWEKDRFAGVDNRSTLGGGYGREFNPFGGKLMLEIGAQHSWEDRKGGEEEKFGSLRGYAGYGHILALGSVFTQTVELIKDFHNGDAYRLNTISAVSSSLFFNLRSKTSYEVKYDNEPIQGFSKTDTILSLALLLDF